MSKKKHRSLKRKPKAEKVAKVAAVQVTVNGRCLGCGDEMQASGIKPWCLRCYRKSMREFVYGNTCLYLGED